MEIGSAVVQILARQVGYVVLYKGYIADLRHATSRLDKFVKDKIEPAIAEARESGGEISLEHTEWVSEAKEVIEYAEIILNNDEVKAQWSCHRGILNPRRRMVASRKARRSLQRIQYLFATDFFSRTSVDNVFSKESSNLSALIVKNMVEALSCRTLDIIGAWVGTSTNTPIIVKELKRLFGAENWFDEVLALSPLEVRLYDHFSISQLTQKNLSSTQTTLAILYGLSERLDLEEIKVHIGSSTKLLLISEDRKILVDTGAQLIFKIDSLTQDDSWMLFKKAVGQAAEYPHIKPIAIELARECADSPILIDALAKKLKHCGLNGWDDTLQQLQASKDKLEFAREILQDNEEHEESEQIAAI